MTPFAGTVRRYRLLVLGHLRCGATMKRRTFLHLAAGAATVPILPRLARAQTYPTRPVRIVVGFAAGGPASIVARLIGQSLSQRLGQQFIIENRAGAASNLAAEAVVRASPDGYTLLFATTVNTINESLYGNLNFDFNRDIAAVGGIIHTPHVMVVRPSFPARTVPEFIVYAKANPGKLNFGSGGIGSVVHVAGELFKMRAGVDMVHVPYRGAGPALADLLGGQLQVMFDVMPSSIEHVRAGTLRALAVTTRARSEALPDVPTVGEFLPGFEASTSYGIGAPKQLPAEIVDRLNKEINSALADPEMRSRLAELGGSPLQGAPADFQKLLADETEKWAQVIKFANIKPE
jgi:tripartite-type tricarboxylate transporter receptor subunit TctC